MAAQEGSPRQSLWGLIVEHVPHSELSEIRTVLGESLVDMYTDVHSEVDMWLGIWRGIKEGSNHSNVPGNPHCRGQGSTLADPPVVKELLRAEIRMLLQSVRERASKEGRDGEEVLSRYDHDTVSYALGHAPVTRIVGHPQQGSRSGTPSFGQPTVSEELDAVKDKLNLVHIDRLVVHLRSVLTEDIEALNRQVSWLQEDTYKRQSGMNGTEPTLAAMREQRRVIQMDLDLPSPFLPRRPSPSVSSSPFDTEKLKDSSTSPAGRRSFDKTPEPRTATSDLVHSLPSPLAHVKPSPPAGPPLTRPSASVRTYHTSLLARARDLRSRPILPNSSGPSLMPMSSSTGNGIAHLARSHHIPDVKTNVYSVSDTDNPQTQDGKRERNDVNLSSMRAAREKHNGRRNSVTDGHLYNIMNNRLMSVTGGAHAQNDSHDNSKADSDNNTFNKVWFDGSVTQPIGYKQGQTIGEFPAAAFQPVPPAIPKVATRDRHLAKRLVVLPDCSSVGL